MNKNIREAMIGGNFIIEKDAGRCSITYMNNRMVKTDWDETVSILNNSRIPEFEDDITAMQRVVGAFGSNRY